MAIPSTSKCVLVLCLLNCTVSLVASEERKDAPNDACSENIRALRQELQILRHDLRMQRKRIEIFETKLQLYITVGILDLLKIIIFQRKEMNTKMKFSGSITFPVIIKITPTHQRGPGFQDN